MIEPIREFGARVIEAHYELRRGGYSVILCGSSDLAVVTTPDGWFLPGGGQEFEETPEQAAIREAREECGLEIEILKQLGVADEFAYSGDKQKYFRKRCTFFLSGVKAKGLPAVESDHTLFWISPKSAISWLNHGSQRWAVTEALKSVGVAR